MMVMVTGNINPADCATLEFPVSPALIFITWWLVVSCYSNESKQKKVTLYLFLKQFYS